MPHSWGWDFKMKIITLLLLLIGYNCVFSQPLRTYGEYYNYNLDSIAKANVANIVYKQPASKKFTTNPMNRFKFTARVQLNSSAFANGLTTEDLLSFGAYDLRVRFYITPDLKVFQRMFIVGTKTFYTTGVVFKF